MNPQDPNAPQSAQELQAAPVVPQAAQPTAQGQQPEKNLKTIEFKLEDDLVFTITSDQLDDMRFFKLFKEVEENILKVYDVIDFMVGEAGMEKIYSYYENKGGKFKITKAMPAFREFTDKMSADPDFLDFSAL